MSENADVVSSAPQDADLVARTRAGDAAAYGLLFSRHRDAATRLARQLTRNPAEADDLVSDAFARVLRALSSGGGPSLAFRPYLLTVVRHAYADQVRTDRKLTLTGDLSTLDPAGLQAVPQLDPVIGRFEQTTAARAYASLPERWQVVLWHTEVEGETPATVAPLVGLSANGVAALAYRAREGLRQAYLQMHLATVTDQSCRWTTAHLGGFVRAGLSDRQKSKVQTHLDTCERCPGVARELATVNERLPALLAPVALGALAAGYLDGTIGTVGAAVAEAGSGLGAAGGASAGAEGAAEAGATAGPGAGAGAGLTGEATGWVARLPAVVAGSPGVAAAVGIGIAASLGAVLFGLAITFGGDPDAPSSDGASGARSGAADLPAAGAATTSATPSAATSAGETSGGEASTGEASASDGPTEPAVTSTLVPTSPGGQPSTDQPTITSAPTTAPSTPPTSSAPPPPPPPVVDLELGVQTDPVRLVSPLDARLDVRVKNTGNAPSRTSLVVVPFHTLNINLLDASASPGWACDDQGSKPPYDELECTGPLLRPGEVTSLVVRTSLKVPVAGRLVVEVGDGLGGSPLDVVEIAVDKPNDLASAPRTALLSGTERR